LLHLLTAGYGTQCGCRHVRYYAALEGEQTTIGPRAPLACLQYRAPQLIAERLTRSVTPSGNLEVLDDRRFPRASRGQATRYGELAQAGAIPFSSTARRSLSLSARADEVIE
jgi:hypothetical protein